LPGSGATMTWPTRPSEGGPVSRVPLLQDAPQVVADQVDQPDRPQRLAGMVHVQDQRHDAGDHQAERDQDREARDRAALVVDLSQGEDRLGEGGREQPDGQLAGTILEQRAHDARGELAHGQLHRDQRDGQHQLVSDTIEVAKVLRMDWTADGPPVRPRGISW
jgi:hypothetical protein